jgi:hypothetical protein
MEERYWRLKEDKIRLNYNTVQRLLKACEIFGFIEFFSGRAETSAAVSRQGERIASFDKEYKPKGLKMNYFDILTPAGLASQSFLRNKGVILSESTSTYRMIVMNHNSRAAQTSAHLGSQSGPSSTARKTAW